MYSLLISRRIYESIFSIMKRIKSNTRNRMADETPDACLRLSTTEIKANIDTIIKIKKKLIVLLFCWYVVYCFCQKLISLVVGKRRASNYPYPKLCQACRCSKVVFFHNAIVSFAARRIFFSLNVALHTHTLGSPWSSNFQAYTVKP